MKLLYFTFFFISTISTYSQTGTVTVESHELNDTKFHTYVLDVSTVYANVVESLRDELNGWDDKVHEVIFDSSHSKLYITYTSHFNDIEFIEVLGKYSMSKKMIVNHY